MKLRPVVFTLMAASFLLAELPAAASELQAAPGERAETYQLAVRDLVRFSILDEPEMVVEQRIDGQGCIRVPYLGNIVVAGLSAREAEHLIERSYVENYIYIAPQAMVRVIDYSIKDASVLGQVKNPGKISFPIEVNSLDIREAISEAGGLTGIARAREVRVTRPAKDGREQVFIVNVDHMLTGRGGEGERTENFEVLPGDMIFVPERFF